MNPSEFDAAAVSRALDDFFRAMDLRTNRNVRVGKRVTLMLRVGVVSLVLLALLMAGMIWAFTDRVGVMIGVLGTMRTEFSGMAGNMTEMHRILGGLERDMASFSVVTDEMDVMRSTVSEMTGEVQEMAGRMAIMSGDVNLVTGNVANMNQSFRLLGPSVSAIGAKVDRGSGPMKTFYDVSPFSGMLP
jgi:hypothetical protein